jgi:hypothetical protein
MGSPEARSTCLAHSGSEMTRKEDTGPAGGRVQATAPPVSRWRARLARCRLAERTSNGEEEHGPRLPLRRVPALSWSRPDAPAEPLALPPTITHANMHQTCTQTITQTHTRRRRRRRTRGQQVHGACLLHPLEQRLEQRAPEQVLDVFRLRVGHRHVLGILSGGGQGKQEE